MNSKRGRGESNTGRERGESKICRADSKTDSGIEESNIGRKKQKEIQRESPKGTDDENKKGANRGGNS
jgi:hypothetical protein